MTTEDVMITKIMELTSLTEADIKGLKQCTPTELDLLVRAYVAAGKVPSLSVWEEVVSLMQQVSSYASIAAPLLSVVQLALAL